jgi:hypothetical protein
MTGLKPLMMAASLAFLVPAAYAGTGPMMQMQGRIQQMQRVVDRIRATKNPRERQRLLQQHLREMRQAMSIMNRGMMSGGKNKAMGHGAASTLPMNPCGMGSGGKGAAMGGGKGARMSPEQMQTMIQRMTKHQQVMEMMINQIVEHMGAQGGGK